MRRLLTGLAVVAFAALVAVGVTIAADPAVVQGVPRPATAPSCVGKVGVVGAAADLCVYACSTAGLSILAGSDCTFATP